MKWILLLVSLFCIATATAQPLRWSEKREPVRSELIAYPSLEEAIAAAKGASKYLTPLENWRGNANTFSTEFTYPFAWANRQILLHIASAWSDYEIFVNGESAGYNTNPNAPTDFNITKFAREGSNTLEIRTNRNSPLTQIESWKEDASAPQLGHTYLLSQPTMRIRDVGIKTWSIDNEMKAEIGVVIRSSALNPKISRIHYELRTPSNEIAASGHKDFSLDMRREDTLRFVTTIPKLLQWTSELPTQYDLYLKTQYEGRYVEYLHMKVGFRTVEIVDDALSINGLPVTLYTKEVSPDISANQIARLKEQGYNTIKLRPGAVDTELLDDCDLLGMYVIAQAPIDSHNSGEEIRLGGNPTNAPAWTEGYLERTADTYHATKRHPSVVAFSLAEKSANGIGLYESYLNMKQMDDARPFIYRDAGGQWNSDTLRIVFTPSQNSL